MSTLMHPRYQILGRIDTGGMAEVFRAIAESTVGGMKRQVAIKRILPELTHNKKFIAMFLDEARLSLHLQHANIVQVTDIGKSDTSENMHASSYFLVMEYVDGVNLKSLLEQRRKTGETWPLSHGLYIAMEVCKALAYAHALTDPETHHPLGIVHRDVSPANILLSRKGEVKLTDFGLAKAASQLQETEPGIVKGKFSYLSSEAARGLDVDGRADLFSLGAVLFEMITGQRLFEGQNNLQTVQQVQKAVIPIDILRSCGVDYTLEAILLKALAPNPADRYQDASAMLDDLASYLFKHNLKVTSHDIEQWITASLDRKAALPPRQLDALTNALLQEEILRFTSLDDLDTLAPSPSPSFLRPPKIPSAMEDPRDWERPAASALPPPHKAGATRSAPPPLPPEPQAPPPLADPTLVEPVQKKREESTPGLSMKRRYFFIALFFLLCLLVAFLLLHPTVQQKLCTTLEVFCAK